MFSFITNKHNDLFVDKYGNLCLESGLEAYRQIILNKLYLQQYEYPYDMTRGINYLGYVLGNAPNIQAWEAQVLDMIKNLSFVKRIEKWEYRITKENLEFLLKVITDLGEVEFRG